jgi:hypothetical protein
VADAASAVAGVTHDRVNRRPVLRDLLRVVRPALLPAIAVGLLAGVLCGAAGFLVAAGRPVTYASSAVFTVAARAPEVKAVSRSSTLVGEQTIRVMATGPAEHIARDAVGGAEIEPEWVVGPKPDQISYRVTSPDPAVAREAAQAVLDRAGYIGRNLRPAGATPLLFAASDTVTPPARVQKSDAVTAVGPAIAGGGSGALLVLLASVRPRPENRRRTDAVAGVAATAGAAAS